LVPPSQHQPLPETISESFVEAVEATSDTSSHNSFTPPGNFSTSITAASISLVGVNQTKRTVSHVADVRDNQLIARAVEVTPGSNLLSLSNLNSIQSEPYLPKFKTMTQLLKVTNRLHNYPNFPELPNEPILPDISNPDPMHPNAIRISNALITSVWEAIQESQTYEQALASPDREQWIQAMNTKFQSLIKNHTWDLVQLPKGKKAVQNKWIYKVNYKSDGLVEKYKAGLMAKGFTQEVWVDFKETYSPVIRYNLIQATFAIAAAREMKLQQFDIGIAFLNGNLVEEIYMYQPKGFINPIHSKLYCQ
jgi:hypothetical protein